MITLVLGGTRSGKSVVAERLAASLPQPVTYVATGRSGGDDADLAARIAAHRARRPGDWTTVEAGAELVGTLREHPGGTALVDALGSWVAHHPDLRVDVTALVAALQARRGDTVIVSEEVGLSVHPPTEAGRQFVDTMGELNRAVADIAERVLLVVAGRVLSLDRE